MARMDVVGSLDEVIPMLDDADDADAQGWMAGLLEEEDEQPAVGTGAVPCGPMPLHAPAASPAPPVCAQQSGPSAAG
jgi:hypothetical protein